MSVTVATLPPLTATAQVRSLPPRVVVSLLLSVRSQAPLLMFRNSVTSVTAVTVMMIRVYNCVGTESPAATSAEDHRLTALPSSVKVLVAGLIESVGASFFWEMVRV